MSAHLLLSSLPFLFIITFTRNKLPFSSVTEVYPSVLNSNPLLSKKSGQHPHDTLKLLWENHTCTRVSIWEEEEARGATEGGLPGWEAQVCSQAHGEHLEGRLK